MRKIARRRGRGPRGLFLVIGLLAGTAVLLPAAQSLTPGGRAYVDVMSAHVWRGLTLSDGATFRARGMVESADGLGVEAWDIVDSDGSFDGAGDGRSSELGWAAWYRLPLTAVDVTLGFNDYAQRFRHDLPETTEVFLRAGWQHERLLLTMEHYYDVDKTHGYYGRLSGFYAFPMMPDVDLTTGGSVSVANNAFSRGYQDGWHDYSLSLGVSYTGFEQIDIAGGVAYTDSLDEDVLPDQEVGWHWGVEVGFEF